MNAEHCVRVNTVFDEHNLELCSHEHGSMNTDGLCSREQCSREHNADFVEPRVCVRVNTVFELCSRVRVFDEHCVCAVFACSRISEALNTVRAVFACSRVRDAVEALCSRVRVFA